MAALLCADTHCHLDDPSFSADLPDIIQRAKEAGIHPLIAPAESLTSGQRILEIASTYPSVLPCIGVHPHKASEMRDDEQDRFVEMSQRPDVVGIGEIGLDYYYEFSDRKRQKEVCSFFLDVAARAGKPVCLHVRDKSGLSDATTDILELLKARAGKIRGVVHCFTGTWDEARQFLDLGFHISFTGILTFKKASNVRDVFLKMPLDRVLLETDSPYLAPEPHRGKRNEPAFLALLFAAAQSCRQISAEDLSARLCRTERDLFSFRCDVKASVLEIPHVQKRS